MLLLGCVHVGINRLGLFVLVCVCKGTVLCGLSYQIRVLFALVDGFCIGMCRFLVWGG